MKNNTAVKVAGSAATAVVGVIAFELIKVGFHIAAFDAMRTGVVAVVCACCAAFGRLYQCRMSHDKS